VGAIESEEEGGAGTKDAGAEGASCGLRSSKKCRPVMEQERNPKLLASSAL